MSCLPAYIFVFNYFLFYSSILERGSNTNYRKLYNEAFHNSYFNGHFKVASEYEVGGSCSIDGKDEKCLKNLGWRV
jgi:hypothetical protein